MSDSIQIKQQIIRSLIENFDWETNPKVIQDWWNIYHEIKSYWVNYLNADWDSSTRTYNRNNTKQKEL